MTAVTVKAGAAGHALIRVPGAGGVAATQFRVSRSPDWAAFNLGPGGWQGAEALLEPESVTREGNDLVLGVGPAVCNVLEPDTYDFALPAANLTTRIVWPDEVLPSHSGSGPSLLATQPKVAVQPVQPTQPPEPVKLPEPPVVPEPLKPTPVPAPISTAKRNAGIGGAVLLAALIVAALVTKPWTASWWPGAVVTPPPTPTPVPSPTPTPSPTPSPTPTPTPTPTPEPTPTAADPDNLSVADLARGDPAVMLAQAQKRMATKPQDSLLLLEVAGDDRHYGPALAALGKLYDPGQPRQGGIPADARQAAKAYAEAARAGDNSASAEREALHTRLIAQRDAGNMDATLILKDFWQ